MWGLIAFLVGIAYGFFSPGRENKGRMLRNGLLIGVVLAIVFALIGYTTGANALGVGGAFGIILTVLIVTLLFVLGVWIGDLLEGRRERRAV